MTPRGRVALIVVGVTVGILVLFIGTVWVLMNVVSDEGLGAGGPRVAVVEIEGIIVDGSSAVRELREHAENPAVKAVVLRVNSPGGVVAPTQEIFAAIQRVRKAGKPVVTTEKQLAGRVERVNAVGRFVVLSFPTGRMPAQDQRLALYRRDVKVGEVKVTGPQRGDNIVADIVSGEPEVSDEVREN